MRFAVFVTFCLLLGGCGFDSHAPADAGVDATSPPVCVDADGDGYGAGDGCAGPDCREDDPTVHECVCDAQGLGTGCPCGGGAQPVVCYDGTVGTAGVGTCRAGLRRCEGGAWTECRGQVVPLADEQSCDYEDEDCDGVADDGLLSECGNCNQACQLHRFGVGGEPFTVDEEPAPDVLEDGSVTISDGGELRAVLTELIDTDRPDCPARWGTLDMSADTPDGASVLVEVRSGWSLEELQASTWVLVLHPPYDHPPVELTGAVGDDRYLQIRVTLLAEAHERRPVLHWLTVTESGQGCGFG